jgi:hypothetical protein
MDMAKFEVDRQIDPSELDLAAATQADTFFYWAEQLTAARMRAEQCKHVIDLTEARVELECRQNPEKFGLVKSTEAAISSAVKASADVVSCKKEFLEAREESMLLDWAVNAMEQRKRMIEVLITLHGQQYFAGPSTPRDLVTAWQERRDTLSQSVTDRQRARSRKRSSKRS